MAEGKNLPFHRRLGFAFQGIASAARREKSFRVQLLGAVFILFFCITVRPSALWCAIFFLACALVIALELVNTAFEAMIDKLYPERDPEIGFAKDCLAGAVLVASFAAVCVFIFYVLTV